MHPQCARKALKQSLSLLGPSALISLSHLSCCLFWSCPSPRLSCSTRCREGRSAAPTWGGGGYAGTRLGSYRGECWTGILRGTCSSLCPGPASRSSPPVGAPSPWKPAADFLLVRGRGGGGEGCFSPARHLPPPILRLSPLWCPPSPGSGAVRDPCSPQN